MCRAEVLATCRRWPPRATRPGGVLATLRDVLDENAEADPIREPGADQWRNDGGEILHGLCKRDKGRAIFGRDGFHQFVKENEVKPCLKEPCDPCIQNDQRHMRSSRRQSGIEDHTEGCGEQDESSAVFT